MLIVLKSKIHRATVTDGNLNYEGSIDIDEKLMRVAGIVEYERVLVVNINNGARFETYAVRAPADSGSITLNGAAARLGHPGDLVIIMAFEVLQQGKKPKPRIILVDENNRIKKISDDMARSR